MRAVGKVGVDVAAIDGASSFPSQSPHRPSGFRPGNRSIHLAVGAVAHLVLDRDMPEDLVRAGTAIDKAAKKYV